MQAPILQRLVSSLLALSCLAVLPQAAYASVEMTIPPGNYAKQLGNGSIADPSGINHNKAFVAGKVVVAIFTIPNMSHGGTQEKWSKILTEDPKTKVADAVFVVLFEDMSQAGWTKGMARSSMKKEFTPTARPFLVLDETGDVTKHFGVPADTTRILIYDKNGKLRDVESDLKNTDATDFRIKDITARLSAE